MLFGWEMIARGTHIVCQTVCNISPTHKHPPNEMKMLLETSANKEIAEKIIDKAREKYL